MAWKGEQYPSGGGGNRDEGTDIQLTPQEPEPQANGDWLVEGVPRVQLMSQELEPQVNNDWQTEGDAWGVFRMA